MDTSVIMQFLPIIIIQVGLAVYALIKLYNIKNVRYMNKILWTLIIVFINIIGPIIFIIVENEGSRNE